MPSYIVSTDTRGFGRKETLEFGGVRAAHALAVHLNRPIIVRRQTICDA
jgi:hypothetical protein